MFNGRQNCAGGVPIFRILRYESGGKQKTKGKSVFRLADKTAGNGSANVGSNPIAQS